MARLEGVKVFDAKEGSIEKLMYEGDIYVKTKDLPKKGDIALVNVAWDNQIEGEYYLVNNEDNDMYELAKELGVEKDYVFIEGEMGDADTKPHRVEIFRKHIVAKEGDLIEKEVEYKVGDLVEIIEEGSHEFEIGEVVRLNKVDDPAGQPYRAERLDGGVVLNPWLYGHEFKRFDGTIGKGNYVVETPTETPTYKIGDIVVVAVELGTSSLDLGDIGIITEKHMLFGMFRVAVPGKENDGNLKYQGNIRHATEEERKQFAINLVKEGAFA